MIQLSKSSTREFLYNSEKDDYFYKDNGQRVPDNVRDGFRTTVFHQSSARKIENETPEQQHQKQAKWEETKLRLRRKYNPTAV
jgi:hypothetical protein